MVNQLIHLPALQLMAKLGFVIGQASATALVGQV